MAKVPRGSKALPEAILGHWKKLLGLGSWRIILLPRSDRPNPSSTSAFSETDFATHTAHIWADSEEQIIHELLHVLMSSLHDAFWRAAPPSSLRRLFDRREERIVSTLERVLVRRRTPAR